VTSHRITVLTSTTNRENEMNQAAECYEVRNPSFSDLNIEQQIEYGINDWVAVDRKGREFFGRTKAEALSACAA
jgi:hypothetical protein